MRAKTVKRGTLGSKVEHSKLTTVTPEKRSSVPGPMFALQAMQTTSDEYARASAVGIDHKSPRGSLVIGQSPRQDH